MCGCGAHANVGQTVGLRVCTCKWSPVLFGHPVSATRFCASLSRLDLLSPPSLIGRLLEARARLTSRAVFPSVLRHIYTFGPVRLATTRLLSSMPCCLQNGKLHLQVWVLVPGLPGQIHPTSISSPGPQLSQESCGLPPRSSQLQPGPACQPARVPHLLPSETSHRERTASAAPGAQDKAPGSLNHTRVQDHRDFLSHPR